MKNQKYTVSPAQLLDTIPEILVKHGKSVADYPDRILHMSFPATQVGASKCFWEFFINGNAEERTVKAEQWGEIKLAPFEFALFWNGFLAGLFTPAGGQMAQHQEGANSETFLAALRAHLSKL